MVGVLVPDLAGVDPAVQPVAEDADAREAVRAAAGVVVGHDDDLGLLVAVHVHDERVLPERAAGVALVEQDRAVAAVEDAQAPLVVVDDLGRPVAVEVEDARAGRAAAGVGGAAEEPEHRAVLAVDDQVAVAAGRGHLGPAVPVEVRHGGRPAAARPPGRGAALVDVHRAPLEGPVGLVGEDGVGTGRDEDDLRRPVAVQVGHGGPGAARGLGRLPEQRAVVLVDPTAADVLEVAVAVEVGEGGVVDAVAGPAAHEGAVGVAEEHRAVGPDELVAHRDLHGAVAVHVREGRGVVAADHAREPAQQRAVGPHDEDVPGHPVAAARPADGARASDDLGPRGAGVDLPDGDARARGSAVARLGARHRPQPAAVGSADGPHDAVPGVRDAGEGVEDHVGRVPLVDDAVAVVVVELRHHGGHHHLVVGGEGGPIAVPLPLDDRVEGAGRRPPGAFLSALPPRQAPAERRLAVLVRGAAGQLVARIARRDAVGQQAHVAARAAARPAPLPAGHPLVGTAQLAAALHARLAFALAAGAAADGVGRAAALGQAALVRLAARAGASRAGRHAGARRVRASVRAGVARGRRVHLRVGGGRRAAAALDAPQRPVAVGLHRAGGADAATFATAAVAPREGEQAGQEGQSKPGTKRDVSRDHAPILAHSGVGPSHRGWGAPPAAVHA